MMSYSKELQKVQDWENTSIEAKANVQVETTVENEENVKFSLPIEITGKAKGQDLVQMNMKMGLKELKAMAKESGEDIEDMPDEINMNIFATKDKAYIEKKFFTELLKDKVPEEIKNIKEDYIALNVSDAAMGEIAPEDKAKLDEITEYASSKEFEAKVLDILEKAFKEFKPSKDIKITGNTYSYDANINDLVKDFNSALEVVVNNYSEIEEPIMELMKKFNAPVKQEDLKQIVDSYNKEQILEQSKTIEKALDGSNISMKTTFGKDSYKEDVKANINVANLFKLSMDMSSNAKKLDKAEIKLPTSVKEISMMEYISMLTSMMPEGESGPMVFVRVNGEDVDFEDQDPILKENRTLVPIRGLLENIGAEVNWDQKAQKVTAKKDDMNVEFTIGSKVAKVNGKDVNLDVAAEVVNNRTMIPLRFISENLGYKVKFDNENSPLYMIDIYNISEEELAQKEAEKLKELQELFKTEETEAVQK